MPIQTLEIKIVPKEMHLCDHMFRYYEPQSTKTYVKIPKFLPFSISGMYVRTSNREIKADINHQESEIFLLCQTERAPKKTSTYVYLYQDQYSSLLLASCQVEIYAM